MLQDRRWGRLLRVHYRTRSQDGSGHPATFSLAFSLWTQVGSEVTQPKSSKHWFGVEREDILPQGLARGGHSLFPSATRPQA